jgi:hypothetical protein
MDSQKELMMQFINLLKSLAERIMLPDNHVNNVDLDGDGQIDGYRFGLRNPFYSAQSVAWNQDLKVEVDGISYPSKKISFFVRGQKIPVLTAKTVYELYWGFGEVIDVYVEKPGGLDPGRHELNCTLSYGNYLAMYLGKKAVDVSAKREIIVK